MIAAPGFFSASFVVSEFKWAARSVVPFSMVCFVIIYCAYLHARKACPDILLNFPAAILDTCDSSISN